MASQQATDGAGRYWQFSGKGQVAADGSRISEEYWHGPKPAFPQTLQVIVCALRPEVPAYGRPLRGLAKSRLPSSLIVGALVGSELRGRAEEATACQNTRAIVCLPAVSLGGQRLVLAAGNTGPACLLYLPVWDAIVAERLTRACRSSPGWLPGLPCPPTSSPAL